jgi:hypothetical protein
MLLAVPGVHSKHGPKMKKKDTRFKISGSQREELIGRRRSGEASAVLATDYGLCGKTVNSILVNSLATRTSMRPATIRKLKAALLEKEGMR